MVLELGGVWGDPLVCVVEALPHLPARDTSHDLGLLLLCGQQTPQHPAERERWGILALQTLTEETHLLSSSACSSGSSASRAFNFSLFRALENSEGD